MKLFFDTNIYGLLAEASAAKKMRRALDRRGWRVTASSMLLIELAQTSNPERRRRLLRTLTTVAADFEAAPDSYVEAQEVLAEVRRWRKEWLKPSPALTTVKRHLREKKALWRDVQSDPDALSLGRLVEGFWRQGEEASDAMVAAQKQARRPGGTVTLEPRIDSPGPDFDAPIAAWRALPRPEKFVRFQLFTHWQAALQGRIALRDLADWMAPHLKPPPAALALSADFARFFLVDLQVANIPSGCVPMLLPLVQFGYRVVDSNPIDVEHAAQVFGHDVFVTADKNFSRALTEALAMVDGLSARRHAAVAYLAQPVADPVAAIVALIRDGSG